MSPPGFDDQLKTISEKDKIDFPLGAVLLDLDERDLPSIAARVVDHMVACDQIPQEQRDSVVKILLLRHKHIKETQNALRRVSMSVKSGSMMQLMSESADEGTAKGISKEGRLSRKGTLSSISNIFHVGTFNRTNSGMQRVASMDDEEQANGWSNGKKLNSRQNSYTQIDLEEGLEVKSKEQIEKAAKSSELMKKIPEGAEATAVLVGAVDFLKTPTIAFVRLAEGVTMENVIEVPIPVRFIFVLLGPFNGEMDYHEVGRSISTLMSDKAFHEVAYRAHSRGQLLSAINEFLNASIVLPPTDFTDKELVPIDEIRAKTQEILKKNENLRAMKKQHELETRNGPLNQIKMPDSGDEGPPKRDPLTRKGIPFYGLVQDIKERYSQYPSDIMDGLNVQVVSATIFIFFAALSPAVTFGGMYGDQTDNYIGVGETLLVSSINGGIFALFAAQPLLIVGATGPLMIFDMSLYKFCEGYDLDYLSIRVWVGIWMVIIGLLVVAFEAMSIVRKFTRFLEEIFSTLVCIIFIYEAFAKLANIFKMHPLQGTYGEGCHMRRNATMGLMEMLRSNSSMDDSMNMTEMDSSMMNDTADTTMDDVEITTVESIMTNDSTMELGLGDTIKNAAANILETMMEEEDEEVLPQPNTALLSMCLMLGTFIIAFKLKKFRNSKYLGRGIRRALGDFGVPISIILMVVLDILIRDTYTDKLAMPEGLEPSNSKVRGWIINPLGVTKPLPLWCMIAAGPAALLLFILIFIEENICHLILAKPERCLKKGSGFHLDILLSCLINTISGFLGAPFMGPACVRTISHMSALTVVSSNVPPGESPKIVGCLEQRVSGLVVSVLVGLSVMLYFVLNLVPSAVLLGIFLYMGISSTAGIQLLERTILFFVPVKHHPKVPYVNKVRTAKMHMFTGIQVLILVVLWIVKQSPASLCIPFILLLLIPIRMYLMPLIFTKVELIALDGSDPNATDNADDELDFYEHMHNIPNQVDTEDDDETNADKIHKS